MSSISAVLILKNEEQNLADCLQTLDWVDEIVVLDSGSTDNTLETAKSFGAKVFVREDWEGFGEQRRRAQELASCDWIFMIDADERVTPELKQSIQKLIQGEPAIGNVARLSWCFGAYIRHSGWYPGRVMRVYPRHLAQYNDSLVHEKLLNPNNLPLINISGDLLHYTYDSLHHYLSKTSYYLKLWADARHERGKKSSISSAIGHGLWCFIRMYILKLGFLDGRQGFILAVLSGHSTFVKYTDLWIRQQPDNPTRKGQKQ